MPTIWPAMHPLGLHQDPEANRSPAETAGDATDHLHINPGRVQGAGTGSCNRPAINAAKQSQMSTGTDTNNRVSRVFGRLTQARAEHPQWEGEKDQSGHTIPVRRQASVDQEAVPVTGHASSCHQGSAPDTSFLLQTSAGNEAGRDATDHLHINPGRVQGAGTGSCNRPAINAAKQSQMSTGTDTNNRVSRVFGRLTQARAEHPQWEGEKDQSGHTIPVRRQASVDQEAVPVTGHASSCHQGSAPDTSFFLQTSAGNEAGRRAVGSRLLHAVKALHRGTRNCSGGSTT